MKSLKGREGGEKKGEREKEKERKSAFAILSSRH